VTYRALIIAHRAYTCIGVVDRIMALLVEFTHTMKRAAIL